MFRILLKRCYKKYLKIFGYTDVSGTWNEWIVRVHDTNFGVKIQSFNRFHGLENLTGKFEFDNLKILARKFELNEVDFGAKIRI